MLGVVGGYDFLADPQQDLVLEVEARQDVANDNGLLATIRGSYGRSVERQLAIRRGGRIDLGERRLHELYFGIDAADAARSGLDQFDADEGFKDVSVAGALTYRLFERWAVSLIAGYRRLINDAEDSPVIDDPGRNQI